MATFDELAEAVARAFDRACEAAAREPGFEGVYVSPLWEVEAAGDPGRVRGWKRSVLRRVPGAGAHPWGHLFLIVTDGAAGHPRIESQLPGLALGTESPLVVPLPPPLWEGPPLAQLLMRARGEATGAPLRSFADALRKEFVAPRGL